MSNYYDEMDDNEDYSKDYNSGLAKELESIEDEDEREALVDELTKIRYTPSANPRQDIELNLLRAKKIIKDRERQSRDPNVENLLGWLAKEDGITLKEARKKYKKSMKDNGRILTTRYGI